LLTTHVSESSSLTRARDVGTSPAQALMLEALSQRVLRHCDVEVWRELFLGPAYATIRFEVAQRTVVATDAPLDSFSGEEAALLATHLGGDVEPSAAVDLVLSFPQPVAALRAAMVLQRLSAGRRVRTSLSTALCTVACYETESGPRRLMVGPELARAEKAVTQAVPGTIVLTAETYALLGDRINEHVPDGLLATEMEDETVQQASITLAPHASAPMSTFAGLGWN
jgi:hypothetical protein